MKPGVRVLAVAAAPLKKKDTLLVGVVSRADTIEGVLSTKIAVDGTDSTQKIAKMLNRSRFREQVRVIATNGIGLAGLNVIDVKRLESQTSTRVISVTRRKPHPKELLKALRLHAKLEKRDVSERIKSVNEAAMLNAHKVRGFYMQTGMGKRDAEIFVEHAFELLRLAHLVASGVAAGESKGRI